MKKRNTFILLVIMAVVAVMCFTACSSKADNLEDYINNHPDIRAEIDEELGADQYKGITVNFKENDMIYDFDLAATAGMTEELAKSDDVKNALDEGLAGQEAAFKSAANTVLESVREDGAKIDAIRVVVNYNYGDELITSATFDSDPVS